MVSHNRREPMTFSVKRSYRVKTPHGGTEHFQTRRKRRRKCEQNERHSVRTRRSPWKLRAPNPRTIELIRSTLKKIILWNAILYSLVSTKQKSELFYFFFSPPKNCCRYRRNVCRVVITMYLRLAPHSCLARE